MPVLFQRCMPAGILIYLSKIIFLLSFTHFHNSLIYISPFFLAILFSVKMAFYGHIYFSADPDSSLQKDLNI